jgi:RimJ/RimL family protein N-acetyltransferase
VDDLYLETARVRLRQYRPEDLERLVALNSDPEVMRHLTGGRPGTRAEAEEGVARTLLYREKYGGRLGVYTAELRETGAFLGWFHLRPGKDRLDDVLNPELGYRLTRASWGRGLATEVSRALVRKAFTELDAASVWAQTLAANAASRRVMEKAGLRFEAEFPDHGHEAAGPGVRYRLSREAWERGRAD